MTRILTNIMALGLMAFIFSCSPKEQTPKADQLIVNAKVVTMDSENPEATAFAVKDGKFIYVGDVKGAEQFIGPKTKKVDLNGQFVSPGLIDSHLHLAGVGLKKIDLDLSPISNYDQMVEMVRVAVSKAEKGEWIVGRGWHQDKWDKKPEKTVEGMPVHNRMSEVSPDNPVFLRHASGHAGIANAEAMRIANVEALLAKEGQPEGGEVTLDEKGNATGLFNENAMNMIMRHIPEKSASKTRKALRLGMEECLSNGITAVMDAGIGPDMISQYRQLRKSDSLRVRVWAMLDGENDALLEKWFANGPMNDSASWFTLRSVKLYADGALGSRGAWLLNEYEDQPGHTGHALRPMKEIGEIAEKGLESGFQICTHAIGDRANREVLDQYENALGNRAKTVDHRFRIEHAQHLTNKDIPRFAALGVIPAMQGIHMASDRPWAIDRLGEDRIKEGAYVWKKLLASGARVANGTDSPIEPVSPIECFYASVSRKTLKGKPEKGYEPSQRMSRIEALRSYTLDAAYALFAEKRIGSIEVGKLADFTVFDTDLVRADESKLLDAKVKMTVVGGEVLYGAK
ncbi:amidohydrolase [Fulvitalea axinellae]|uniref:Amidohydrolase n=1 Tax=Fulvitalea axinellae TaxID=1182444 RepID=A0AAU9CC34_9BACT|nr:amidohydrolase [Fulvitalea axinellae]